jgi:hypothetical protein
MKKDDNLLHFLRQSFTIDARIKGSKESCPSYPLPPREKVQYLEIALIDR